MDAALTIEAWKTFLLETGGLIENGVLAHFGDSQAESIAAAEGSICCDCATSGWIDVSGKGAEAFLHAQFSNDVLRLGPDHWQPNAYCNPKGRVIALPGLVRRDAGFRMAVHHTVLDSFLQRLRMYVLRADVVFDRLPEIVNIGLSGPRAEQLIRERWPDLSDEPFAAAWSGQSLIRRIPNARAMLSTTPDAAPALWRWVSKALLPVGESRWTWLDIKSGWPTVGAALSQQHIPQALNLDQLGAVNFSKGCYPGQEIVARVHYLGRAKQRMKHGRIDTESTVAPGAAVFADDRRVGDIVEARTGPDGVVDALAVVPDTPDGPLRVGNPDGPELVVS